MTSSIVAMTNVSKHFQQLKALNNISLQLAEGEVLGLFGHNGAGKTTMMKVILGIEKASSGDVTIFGRDPQSKQAWQDRRHIGYLPENVSFYDHLTGVEVLRYFAKLKSVPRSQVAELLALVGLTHAMQRQVKTYSKGMRQRLGLAQAFLGEPKLLLLDEPTVGLDPTATQEFYHSVDSLKQRGASIILCSHVLPGVEQHIERAMILSGGQAIAIGSLAQLRQQARLPVIIQTRGISTQLSADPLLTPFIQENGSLHVQEHEKISVLKQVMAYDGILDISVEPASLEQLYQHYLAHASAIQSLSSTAVKLAETANAAVSVTVTATKGVVS
ncbi:ABC transporter ATP-binding protein [Moritella sp. Urea-trap-13]|uniref:ABC transporter ATP-binding protein n=1 Tax=Moritella sp. Urea-trap-13 TaxID=2058327 RepID=UPI000C32CB2F|nr:ABC transporter ATP-binding protein [Moritella sp. Urea-trap-13]PKH07088.1 copper ABC transporter ATP-binding protein [Moritella sp. Urea-trap-13]